MGSLNLVSTSFIQQHLKYMTVYDLSHHVILFYFINKTFKKFFSGFQSTSLTSDSHELYIRESALMYLQAILCWVITDARKRQRSEVNNLITETLTSRPKRQRLTLLYYLQGRPKML